MWGWGNLIKNHIHPEALSIYVTEANCYSQPPLSTREGNVLFNDALHTFYLRLYDVSLWWRTTQRWEETRCRHIDYSFRLASHRQDNTYHGLCYTSRGALVGKRNSSMGSRFNEGGSGVTESLFFLGGGAQRGWPDLHGGRRHRIEGCTIKSQMGGGGGHGVNAPP